MCYNLNINLVSISKIGLYALLLHFYELDENVVGTSAGVPITSLCVWADTLRIVLY